LSKARRPQPSFEIDLAQRKDLPAMARLLSQLFSQEREFRPDLRRQRAGLSLILDDPGTGCLLVARSRGRVLGMVSLLWSVSTALGGPVAWLEDLVVDRGWRGRGIGCDLLSHARSLALARGALRISLLTDAGNARAQALYTKAGFTPSPMVPLRWLPGQPGNRCR